MLIRSLIFLTGIGCVKAPPSWTISPPTECAVGSQSINAIVDIEFATNAAAMQARRALAEQDQAGQKAEDMQAVSSEVKKVKVRDDVVYALVCQTK